MSILGTGLAVAGKKILATAVGKKVLDKILDTVDKVIPMSKDKRAELEVKLSEIEIENLKTKTEYVKSLGEKFKDYVIPIGVGIFFGMHTINFLTAWVFTLMGKEAFTIGISNEFSEVIKTIIMFFFGYKGATKIMGK